MGEEMPTDPAIPLESEEEENSPPHFTVLTTVRYDFMDVPRDKSSAVMDIDNHIIDYDDSNQVSSTTESTAFQESLLDNTTANTELKNDDMNIVERRRKSSSLADKRSSSPGTPGKSRYGRVRKQKLSTDFVSVDRKLFAVLNSNSYESVISDSLNVSPNNLPIKKGRGRPRKTLSNTPKISSDKILESNTVEVNLNDIAKCNDEPVIPSTSRLEQESLINLEDESSRSSLNLNSIKTYSRKNDVSATYDDKKVAVKNDNLVQIDYPELKWKVGDIAWAKIGCYPYWPSIVTLEYGTSIYVKPVGKQQNRLAVHVHFFGDKGRRSWVLTTSLIKYESKEQFLELKRQYAKDKLRMKYFIIPTRIEELWEKAVTEADTIIKLPIGERTQYYQNLYPITQEMYANEQEKRSPTKSPKKTEPKKQGRKRKILIDSDNQSTDKVKSADVSVTNEEKNKKQQPLDEHLKERRAFMRRMNQMLKQSNMSSLPPKKRIKTQVRNEQIFNKLLHSTPLRDQTQTSSSSFNDSTSSLDNKKNDLSVYDFESDEETDVFIGTYNSKFTPQILNKIEQNDNEPDVNSKSSTPTKLPIYSAVASNSSPAVPETKIVTLDSQEKGEQSTSVSKRGPGRPKGSLNKKKKFKSAPKTEPPPPDGKRKRGRPLGWRKIKVIGVKRGRGRPPGSKNKIKSRMMVQNRLREYALKRKFLGSRNTINKIKRPRGRPRKIPLDGTSGEIGKKINPNKSQEATLINSVNSEERKVIVEKEKNKSTERNSSTNVVSPSSEDEEAKSEEEKRRSSSPPSVPSSRFKKSTNIFLGVKNEKICQICLKPGNTIRCRGSCCGYFHVDCDKKSEINEKDISITKTGARRGRKPSALKNVVADLVKSNESNGDLSVNVEKENDFKETNEVNGSEALSKKEGEKCADGENIILNSEASPKKDGEIVCKSSEANSPNCDPSIVSKANCTKNDSNDIDPVTSTDTTTGKKESVKCQNKEMERNEEGQSELPCKSDHGDLAKNVDLIQATNEEESSENEISSSTGLLRNENGKSENSTIAEKENEKTNDCSLLENDDTCSSDVSVENNHSSTKNTNNSNVVEFQCKRCREERSYPCFNCGKETQDKTKEVMRYNCHLASCGRVYHKECLKSWPQASWGSGVSKESLRCPQHYCHTCISENPAVLKNNHCNEILVKCVKCPTSYHKRVHCIPAGTEILTSSQIICPRHYEPPQGMKHAHFNTSWCFICCIGGSLICCDECPTSFHAECLKLRPEEYEGRYICDDCQTGRLILYGEIAWVKLGHYRWWPAKVLFPNEVPENILNLPHRRGEFVVKFFGSHNYNWVSRGRAFLYQEGDSGKTSCKRNSVDMSFEKAMLEAEEAYKKLQEDKAARNEVAKLGLKPPRYVKIKANKPVGNVRIMEMNTSNITACECDPKAERPCASDSDCLNRMLLVECNPSVCPAGERCMNQAFEKRLYPPLMPYRTDKRGWGLKTLVDMKKGDFIIEYVGEMIDEEEYKRRVAIMHKQQEDNYYFLTIDNQRMLDAGPKGNVSRFMNHSCDPNCETQKWTVNGDTRIGLFASKDITANTELVFNYNLATLGNDKRPCYCGADNCSGFIGMKAVKNGNSNNEEDSRKKSCEDSRKRSADETSKYDGNGNTISRKLRKVMKKKHRQRLQAKKGKLAKAKRTTDLRMKMKNRATSSNVREVMKPMPETSSEDVAKKQIEDDVQNSDMMVVISDTDGELEEKRKVSKNQVWTTSGNPLKKRMCGRPKRVARQQNPLEISLLRSDTMVGEFTNPLIEAFYKNRDAFKKDAAKVVKKQVKSEEETHVERRGRKKIPKDVNEKNNLFFQMIKRRIEHKIENMVISEVDDRCFKCGLKGELLFCDNNCCPRGYHLPCVFKSGWPSGRWLCPWHYCQICQSKCRVLKCNLCTNSYCGMHHKGNIFEESEEEYSCKNHKSGKAIQAFFKSATLMRLMTNVKKTNGGTDECLDDLMNNSLSKTRIIRGKNSLPVGEMNGDRSICTDSGDDKLPNKKYHAQEPEMNGINGNADGCVVRKVSRTARKSIRSSVVSVPTTGPVKIDLKKEIDNTSWNEDQDDFVLAIDVTDSDDEFVDVEVEVLNDSE